MSEAFSQGTRLIRTDMSQATDCWAINMGVP